MLRFVGIDPGTNTGFVALDINGEVLRADPLKGEGKGPMDAWQLKSLENELYKRLRKEDVVAIESVAFGTPKAFTAGMIHGGLQTMIVRKDLDFDLVNPAWTKKYVGVGGSSKKKLTDKEKKEIMKAAVTEHFGWTHKNHNVVDAYIIARIAYNLYRVREYLEPIDTKPYQLEVIQSILDQTEI